MTSERDASFTLVDSDEVINDYDDLRPKDLRQRYLELLDTYPLATKSITSAIIGAVAAMIAGASSAGSSSGGRIKRKHGIQLLDVFAYAICGGIQGPLSHYWSVIVMSVLIWYCGNRVITGTWMNNTGTTNTHSHSISLTGTTGGNITGQNRNPTQCW
jgi:hypothetical protein